MTPDLHHFNHMFHFFVSVFVSLSLSTLLPALQTSSPVSQPAVKKFFCLVYWTFRPPGCSLTDSHTSVPFSSLAHSLASVQEAWGRSAGLSRITGQAVWHGHMIPNYLTFLHSPLPPVYLQFSTPNPLACLLSCTLLKGKIWNRFAVCSVESK